jgi:hypothetical protein
MRNRWRRMAVGAVVSASIAAHIRQRVTAGTAARNRHRSETFFAYHAARYRILRIEVASTGSNLSWPIDYDVAAGSIACSLRLQ